MKNPISRIGRPRKNTIAEPTKVISFRIKNSILKTLDDLAEIYGQYVKSSVSRCQMLEILINGEYRNTMNKLIREKHETE